MIRIVIGAFLAFIGGTGLLQYLGGSAKQDDLIFGSMFFLGGLCLIYFGYRSRKRWKRITESAHSMLRERGSIDTGLLAQQLGLSEFEVLKNVNKSKKKGLIPAEAAPVSQASHVGDSAVRPASSSAHKQPSGKIFQHDSTADTRLEELKTLYREGLLTQDEFNQKKSEILDQIYSGRNEAESIQITQEQDATRPPDEFVIGQNMTVGQLKRNFVETYGISVRIYNGMSIADDNEILQNVGFNKNKRIRVNLDLNTKIGSMEDKFKDKLGIKIQVEDKQGKLADNNLSIMDVA